MPYWLILVDRYHLNIHIKYLFVLVVILETCSSIVLISTSTFPVLAQICFIDFSAIQAIFDKKFIFLFNIISSVPHQSTLSVNLL